MACVIIFSYSRFHIHRFFLFTNQNLQTHTSTPFFNQCVRACVRDRALALTFVSVCRYLRMNVLVIRSSIDAVFFAHFTRKMK